MNEYVTCRLVGGIYDGDQGGILPPLPATIWAVACGSPASECQYKGIHWFFERDAVALNGRVQTYVRGGVGEGDVQLYVHDSVAPEDLAMPAREVAPEPALA